MPPPDHNPAIESAAEVSRLRRLFWHNVLREWLTALPEAGARRPELLDGRLAVLTRAGERIPIKAVRPILTCSPHGAADIDIGLTIAIQCTVFEIHSTTGEVFTLPLHEIRGLHALSEELIEQLEAAVEQGRDAQRKNRGEPFGFAAFTSIARQRSNGRTKSENHADEP